MTTGILYQGGTQTVSGLIYGIKLRSMVFCRGVAAFLGYPIGLDPDFEDVDHLCIFIDILLNAVDIGVLWDFIPIDIAVIFTPLLEYAQFMANKTMAAETKESSTYGLLTHTALAYRQRVTTVEAARQICWDLDHLQEGRNNLRFYEKWMQFLIWGYEYRDVGLEIFRRHECAIQLGMRPMDKNCAEANFLELCLYINSAIPLSMEFMQRVRQVNSKHFRRRSGKSKQEQNSNGNGGPKAVKLEEEASQFDYKQCQNITLSMPDANLPAEGCSSSSSEINDTETDSGILEDFRAGLDRKSKLKKKRSSGDTDSVISIEMTPYQRQKMLRELLQSSEPF